MAMFWRSVKGYSWNIVPRRNKKTTVCYTLGLTKEQCDATRHPVYTVSNPAPRTPARHRQLRADIYQHQYAIEDHVHKVKIVHAYDFAPGMLVTIAGANFMQNGTYRVCSVETDGATCEIV